MSIYNKHFPLEVGLQVQAEQLAGWEKVLKPEVFEKVKTEITKLNEKAIDGYDLKRGSDIYDTVMRIMGGRI
jgi:hypothetical protein